MAGGKWSLAFGGGGGKGSYQIGVWQAMEELGWTDHVDRISGASIGALNGAMFAVMNAEKAQKVWESICVFDVLDIEPDQMRYGDRGGIFTQDGIRKLIRSRVDLSALTGRQESIYANACRIVGEGDSRYETEYFRLNGRSPEEAEQILLASASMPDVYAPVRIGDGDYVDGGVQDNMPVEPLYREGSRQILAVDLHYDFARDLEEEFPEAEIILIKPTMSLGGLMDGTLDFSKDGMRWRRKLGYLDGLRVLQAYERGRHRGMEQQAWYRYQVQLDHQRLERELRQEALGRQISDRMQKLEEIYRKY